MNAGLWGLFLWEKRMQNKKEILLRSKQETIKHNKGNDGDATTLQVIFLYEI